MVRNFAEYIIFDSKLLPSLERLSLTLTFQCMTFKKVLFLVILGFNVTWTFDLLTS